MSHSVFVPSVSSSHTCGTLLNFRFPNKTRLNNEILLNIATQHYILLSLSLLLLLFCSSFRKTRNFPPIDQKNKISSLTIYSNGWGVIITVLWRFYEWWRIWVKLMMMDKARHTHDDQDESHKKVSPSELNKWPTEWVWTGVRSNFPSGSGIEQNRHWHCHHDKESKQYDQFILRTIINLNRTKARLWSWVTQINSTSSTRASSWTVLINISTHVNGSHSWPRIKLYKWRRC